MNKLHVQSEALSAESDLIFRSASVVLSEAETRKLQVHDVRDLGNGLLNQGSIFLLILRFYARRVRDIHLPPIYRHKFL